MLLHSCSCSTSINVIRKRNISIFIVQVIQFEWYHWQFDIISLSPDCSFEKWSVPNSTNFDAVHLHIISIFNSEVEVCMCGVERGRRGYCRRGPTSPISSLGPMHLHFCTVLCMKLRIWRVTRKGEETIYNCMFRTLSRQAGTLGDIDLGPPLTPVKYPTYSGVQWAEYKWGERREGVGGCWLSVKSRGGGGGGRGRGARDITPGPSPRPISEPPDSFRK